MFEYVATNHVAGFGPMLRKLPLHKFDKDDLDKRQFKSYKDAAALLAWASPLTPTSNYMIMIPKDLDKYETEFMVELIKTLYIIIGILAWNWFTLSVTLGTTTILANAGIIKKVKKHLYRLQLRCADQ